jgi:hypothetical protein
MVRIGLAHTRTAVSFVVFAAAFLPSCDGRDNRAGPSPPGVEIRVMTVAASYVEDGQPRMEVTVVVSRDGLPVTDAEVTLNGRAIPRAPSGVWYRSSTLPFADGRTVAIAVISSSGNRTQAGTLPGAVILRQPLEGASIPDSAPVPVAWEPVSWDSTATPHELTLEYTQGNPFHFVTLPPETTGHEIPASVTSPSAMEFLIVEAWSGHADPGSLDRGDWLGQDGLRLGSRAVVWVEIAEEKSDQSHLSGHAGLPHRTVDRVVILALRSSASRPEPVAACPHPPSRRASCPTEIAQGHPGGCGKPGWNAHTRWSALRVGSKRRIR